jgi:large subunit ribosomal protein L18
MAEKVTPREKRKARIRKKLSGTAERPRLTVYRSLNHIYAQLVDDVAGCTIAFAGTTSKALREAVKDDDKVAAAKKVGAALAKAARAQGIEAVVFDRNGFDYHGRVQAVAAAAREAGLKF